MPSKLKVDIVTTAAETGYVSTSTAGIDASSATNGISLPRGSTAQRPTTPPAGTLRWNTTDVGVEVYDGTQWGSVGGGGKKTASITITNPTGNPTTNIPVKVKITSTASGSTGDFGDIKFYSDSAATTPLSYWRETFVSGTYAEFWVKVPTVSSSGATFYAQKASSNTYIGNVNDVFLYYNIGDNISGWTQNRGTLAVSSGVITYTGSGDSAALPTGAWYGAGETTTWDNYIWEYDTRRNSSPGGDYPWVSVRVRSPGGSVTKWWFEGSGSSTSGTDASGNTWRPYTSGSDGGWATQNSNNSGIGRGISNNWERHIIVASGTTGKVFWSTNTFGTAAGATTFGFGHWDYSSQSTSAQSFVQQQNYGSLPTNQGAYGTIAFDNHSGAPNLQMWYKNLAVRKTFSLNNGDTSTSLFPVVTVGTFQ